MRRTLVPISISALVLVLTVGAFAAGKEVGRSIGDTDVDATALSTGAGGEPIAALVADALPSVVNVTTDQFRADPSGGTQQGQGIGTGFVVRADGVIVTNCHVVEGASKITVFMNGSDGASYDARVIGGDCEHDLAVLKVDASGLPTLPIGASSSLELGQRVVAIGFALGLEGGPTVTTGVVSSLDRTITVNDPGCDPAVCRDGSRTYSSVVQTDAAINPGNSGGPLLDVQGRVVGINTAGTTSAENIGFAIAIDSAKDTIARAEQDPLAPSAYLGVITEPVTADLVFRFGLETDHGAYVVATSPSGPAGGAGIHEGDVIVSLDGHAIDGPEDLGNVLGDLEPGSSVMVEFVSASGDTTTLDVTLGTRPLPIELP